MNKGPDDGNGRSVVWIRHEWTQHSRGWLLWTSYVCMSEWPSEVFWKNWIHQANVTWLMETPDSARNTRHWAVGYETIVTYSCGRGRYVRWDLTWWPKNLANFQVFWFLVCFTTTRPLHYSFEAWNNRLFCILYDSYTFDIVWARFTYIYLPTYIVLLYFLFWIVSTWLKYFDISVSHEVGLIYLFLQTI